LSSITWSGRRGTDQVRESVFHPRYGGVGANPVEWMSLAKKAGLQLPGCRLSRRQILVSTLIAPPIRAQPAAAAKAQFEVASIKPCRDGNVAPSAGRSVEAAARLPAD
jgi:hypothetical protein